MKLHDKLLSSFVAYEEEFGLERNIPELRNTAIKQFEAYGFPSKKLEAYKYTSFNALLNKDYNIIQKSPQEISSADIQKYLLDEIDTYKIVFVDGVYSARLSETTHSGMDVCLMSSALTKDKYRAVIDLYYNKISADDGLCNLNTAYAKEGAYIYIPRHTDASKPIQILHFSTGNNENLFLQPRNLIVLEENTHVEIIERHQCLGSAEVFTNSVTEIFVGQRAQLDYYKIQNDRNNASLIDNTFIKQESQSNCSLHTFSFGGNITRNNLQFVQAGAGAESMLNGITIVGEKQHVDHNTLVHHQFENCSSHQDYKGIFAERSTGVFNGRVLVDQKAQKINAYQQNNNILIDDNATINSKPQLEIFADDVKCSHGCTIGQLDDEAMFYMQTRGIPKTEAKALLMYAFAGSVLKTVKIPEIKRKINKIISNKLGVNIGFEL